jgi:hypothetical protein
MKTYQKEIEGKLVVIQANKIVIEKNGMCTYNPTEEMILEDGWVEYVVPEPTEEERLKREKKHKIREIERFDSSKDVNSFSIDGISLWLDKATRVGLKLRFESEIAMGRENTTLWSEGIEFVLPLEMAVQMLYGLELYASACYDNTQRHLATVDKMESIDDVRAYDHKAGYPDKLVLKTI